MRKSHSLFLAQVGFAFTNTADILSKRSQSNQFILCVCRRIIGYPRRYKNSELNAAHKIIGTFCNQSKIYIATKITHASKTVYKIKQKLSKSHSI